MSPRRSSTSRYEKSWDQAISNLYARSARRYSVERLCRLLGVSKQVYHKRKWDVAARKAAMESFALEYIHKMRAVDPGIGGIKLWYMYRRDFSDRERVGRDRFEDVIHRHGLKVCNKMRKPRTTDSTHRLPLYPNLIYSFIPDGINQLWVSDITYIPGWLSDNEYTFCYLSMSDPDDGSRPPDGMPEEALRNLIHHSDRGVQYASKEYIGIMQRNHLRISMTLKGDPR